MANKYPLFSPYQYAANNPLKYIDPDGKKIGLAIRALCNAAKSQWNQFNSAEKTFIKKNPVTSIRAGINMYKASTTARKLYPMLNPHNTIQDAYRHAAWSALNTKDFGQETAEQIADNHENFPNNPPEEKEMDQVNNEIGYKVGDENKDKNDKEVLKKVSEQEQNLQPSPVRNVIELPPINIPKQKENEKE